MNGMDYINKQREVRKIKDRIDAMNSIPEIADVIDSLDEETKTMLLKMYVYDNDRTKVLVTESTPLMPIVGNFLPSDGVNAYTVKITNGKYKLVPILICVSCHWSDLFSGNTKYGENVFCLASDLPRELLEKHIEEIITLGEVPKFLNMNKEEFSKKF